MSDLLSAIGSAAETVKRLRALSKSVENAEIMTLLADLQGDLADAKLEVVNLKGELAKLTDENRELKERLDKRDTGQPTYQDGAYVFAGDEGHFCTACFDTKQKRIRVSPIDPTFSFAGRWQCPVCKAYLG